MMMSGEPTAESPSRQLGIRSQMRFTGRLDVKSPDSQQWSLHLYMGRIIWATGGPHPIRRWHRYMNRYCPKVDLNAIAVPETDDSDYWVYRSLTTLAKQQQITREQAIAVIRNTAIEVLFDIVQQEETRPVTFTCDSQDVLETSLSPLNTEHLLQGVQQEWDAWRSLGLADHSPHLAPVLRRPEQLLQQTNEKAYRTLTSIVDGKRTLRDLTVQTKQDLLPLTRLLVPFFRKGLIGLVQVPDLRPPSPIAQPEQPITTKPPSPSISTLATTPLVVCIDDSVRECQTMEKIVTQAGYRFLGIQDSIQALPILIEQKPNLIFLDLVMPIANGYEVCAQIRRISALKDTPVVILTSNDGIIDRVRAKVVGSSGFLSKPVDANKVTAIAHKFLSHSKRKSEL